MQLLDPFATLDSKPTTIVAATAAANTAVVITLAAQTGYRHYLVQLIWSYSATPTGGRVTITGLKGDDYDWDITAAGPGPANFPPIAGDVSTAVVVTLAAGSGAVVGKLNVAYVTLPAVVVNADGRWIAGGA